jgi:hypothetical protein
MLDFFTASRLAAGLSSSTILPSSMSATCSVYSA